MTQRDLKTYLRDILQYSAHIEQYTAGVTPAAYVQDRMCQNAVERCFMVIGEALNRALQLDPSLRSRIASVPQIIAFRNRLVHVYSETDPEVVLGTARRHLPALVADVERVLHELDAASLGD